MRGGEPGVEEKPGETCGEAPDRGRLADSGTLLAPHTLGPFFSSELSVSRDIKDFFYFYFFESRRAIRRGHSGLVFGL